jgi:thiol:disulfide interchange protein
VWPGANLWRTLSPHHVLTALLVIGSMAALGAAFRAPLRNRELAIRIVLTFILALNLFGLFKLYKLTQTTTPL